MTLNNSNQATAWLCLTAEPRGWDFSPGSIKEGKAGRGNQRDGNSMEMVNKGSAQHWYLTVPRGQIVLEECKHSLQEMR